MITVGEVQKRNKELWNRMSGKAPLWLMHISLALESVANGWSSIKGKRKGEHTEEMLNGFSKKKMPMQLNVGIFWKLQLKQPNGKSETRTIRLSK